MSFLFPRIAYAPVRCGPVRHELAPLFSLFDDTLGELQRASREARKSFNPRFDLKETKEAYTLEGELPGVDQKDIHVEFTDEHTLTIKGRTERHTESGRRPQAAVVEGTEPAAIEEATPASETGSVKSHQATVEDEQPVTASADEVAATPAAEPTTLATEPAKADDQYWFSERHVGEFSRSFNFPSRVDQAAVKASLKNGILSIVVPKAPAPESRRISIE